MKIIPSFELRVQLPLSFSSILSDETYACPTLQWLTGDFWTWFKSKRWELGLTTWKRNNDCDNFARAYAQYAADCHALTTDAAEGLAVGEFYYTRADGAKHAIIVALTDVGVVYIEPQLGTQLMLTPQEIASCFFVHV